MTPAEQEAMKAANAKAEEIFGASPVGRDTQDPVYHSESLLFMDYPDQISTKVTTESGIPQHYTILITRNVVAVMEKVSPLF